MGSRNFNILGCDSFLGGFEEKFHSSDNFDLEVGGDLVLVTSLVRNVSYEINIFYSNFCQTDDIF